MLSLKIAVTCAVFWWISKALATSGSVTGRWQEAFSIAAVIFFLAGIVSWLAWVWS